MSICACWLCLLLLPATIFAWAGELTARPFADTPAPAANELQQPRNLAIDAAGRRYVLDSGLRRLLVFSAKGDPLSATPLDELGIAANDALPADPLLPAPALAFVGDAAYLLSLDRPTRTLTLTRVHGKTRAVVLPEYATNGAVALDAAGRVVVMALRVSNAGIELLLAREDDGGAFSDASILDTLKDPCEGQSKNLVFTGFVLERDGRLAIGIAQGGNAPYSFVRSWLIQASLHDGALQEALRVSHRFGLLDNRGKPLDRYRPLIELAGRAGFPAKPCVPLFTSLAFGPDGTILSGGHSFDPFLRVYTRDGRLQASFPRQATGGQHLAVYTEDDVTRIFAANPTRSRVDEWTLDGRIIGGFGVSLPYDLSAPVALAADDDSVYVITQGDAGPRLMRFTAAGTLAWSQALTPPRGMEKAQPFLAALGNSRVFIGWRQPDADGIGMVEAVMEDGTHGLPLWTDPWIGTSNTVDAICPTPLVTGRNGRLYVLREAKDGTRLQAYSPAGTLLQTFPPEVKGISAVLSDNTLAWVHAVDNGLILTLYSAQGTQTGWKRVRPDPGDLLIAQTRTPWGWQGTSSTLLRLDDTLTSVEDLTLVSADGDRITSLLAFTGNQNASLYFAIANHILVATYQP